MADISVFDFGDGVERNVKDATARSGLTGKADKVTGATNGNLAKLDSNGNLQDSGVAAGNVVQTSNTAGLLKNDGTVDTTTYASEAGTESLINSTVGWTGKNELDSSYPLSKHASGTQLDNITATRGNDGSVIINGSTSGSGNLGYVEIYRTTNFQFDGMLLSGKNGNATTAAKLGVWDETALTGIWLDTVNEAAISGMNGHTVRVTLNIYGGNTYDNMTFLPMIRDARITDPAYEPYHKSVEECKADNTVIASVESGTTASQAYAQGAHFIRDGKFCTAITSIASGATLTKNTNYTEGDVASALSSGGSSGGEVYPSTETKIGTFLGVDLYRKVYKITSISSSFDTGISNAYYITRITGNITKGEAVYNLPHYASSSDRLSVYLQKGSFSDIYYKANFIQSIQDVSYVILIVEYTKENPYA